MSSSVASKNLFAVLDDEPAVLSGAIPTTRKTTTSKKTDEPPARVPGSGSKKPVTNVTGNEAAFKDKSVGRNANRSRSSAGEEATGASRKPSGKKPVNPRPDRKSQTGKTDSDKKIKMGWGDDNKELEEEQAGEAIAKSERRQDREGDNAGAVEEEIPDNTKTLEEYLAELKTKSLKSDRSQRVPNANAVDTDSKWTAVEKAEQEDLFVGGEAKKEKVKARKEKATIEPEITFVSSNERSERRSRDRDSRPRQNDSRNRGPKPGSRPSRGGKNATAGGRGGKPAGRAPRVAMNANLGSASEFPTL